MPYYARRRSRKYNKRRRLTANKVFKRRPSARNQQYQIATLARKVNQVHKQIAIQRDYIQFKTEQTGTLVTSPKNGVYKLIDPDNWTQVFHTDGTQEVKHHYKIKSVALDLQLEANTEPDLCTFTLYVFKIRRDMADRLVNETADLNQFLINVDYVWNGGMALLNRNRYEILGVKRLHTEQAADHNNEDYDIRGPHRYYKKFKTSMLIKKTADQWRHDLTTDRTPIESRIYMVLFNNNATSIEGSPMLRYTTLVSGIEY